MDRRTFFVSLVHDGLSLLLLILLLPLAAVITDDRGRIYSVGELDEKMDGAKECGLVETMLYPAGMKVKPVEGLNQVPVDNIFTLLRLTLRGIYFHLLAAADQSSVSRASPPFFIPTPLIHGL